MSVRAGLQSCIATGTALNLQVESVPARSLLHLAAATLTHKAVAMQACPGLISFLFLQRR